MKCKCGNIALDSMIKHCPKCGEVLPRVENQNQDIPPLLSGFPADVQEAFRAVARFLHEQKEFDSFTIDKKDGGEYREQDGCRNCGRCFTKCEFDAETEYYCTKDAPKRPLCGSLLMAESWEETFGDVTANEYERLFDAAHDEWDKWSEGRERKAWGKCGDWRKE